MKAVLPFGGTVSGWALPAAVLVTMSVACTSSSDSGDGESASSCAYVVEYQSHEYSGTEATDFTIGDKLGAATVPPCDDTPSDDNGGRTAATWATAYAIEGVDPGIAIALDRTYDDEVIFVNVDSGKKLPEIKKLIQRS
ncbi:DUF6281 family protein [Streptomyces sp. NBC_00989]|uniref:DUF6281 family protein n=1 Tax=Streptomyces sp. NBC_00989 TaxID=2903705 RepID=UPI003866CDD2|nr:DUF6281 family protein [Streptomyces sp. NBC_00989]